MCQHYLFCRLAFVNILHANILYELNLRKHYCFYNISDLSTINKTNMTEIMRKRIDVLRENCRLLGDGKTTRSLSIKRIPITLTAGNHHLCKVPKCGSTYWTQVFLVMTDIIGVEKLAQLDREVIHGPLQEQIISREFNSELSDKMILVTRNPWKRIYSAYMDKVYRLQVDYIKQIKRMANIYGNYCGEIPTFEQFLQFIVVMNSRRRKLDPHWRPISTLCRVCSNEYTYIMKLESFVEDSSYVLNELIVADMATKDALISLLTDKYSSESVGQIVRQFTSQLNEMNSKCVPFMDTMKRLWISLQSQGLISDDIAFNVHLFKNLSAVNETEIVQLFVSKQKEKVLSKTERQLQRNRHFSRAYTSVKQKTVKDIRKVYENDFVLFGYDQFLPTWLYS